MFGNEIESRLMQWSSEYNEHPISMGFLEAMEGDTDEHLASLVVGGYAREIPNGEQVPTRQVGIITSREGDYTYVKKEAIKIPVPHYELTQKGLDKINETRAIMVGMVLEWFITYGEREISQAQLLEMFPFDFKNPSSKGLKIYLLAVYKLTEGTYAHYRLTPKALEIIRGNNDS